MKMTYGRKFFACLLALIILCAMFFTALFFTQAVTDRVMIFFGGMTVTICFAYIGGNVWNSWVKSKHFHPELLNGKST